MLFKSTFTAFFKFFFYTYRDEISTLTAYPALGVSREDGRSANMLKVRAGAASDLLAAGDDASYLRCVISGRKMRHQMNLFINFHRTHTQTRRGLFYESVSSTSRSTRTE